MKINKSILILLLVLGLGQASLQTFVHYFTIYHWSELIQAKKSMKQISIFILVFITISSSAQVDNDSDLFKELKKQDSTFFELGFNQCDLEYLKDHIADDLRFYHDQSGFQDRNAFFENTKKYICSNSDKKPIRKVDVKSLEVFPLYSNGKLYGAIQKGNHHFYLRENAKDDLWTSTAKFTHVWVLKNEQWKLTEVLSYDHKAPVFDKK